MGSRWTKKEEEIVKQNFTSAKWEDFMSMLSEKTENQILSKANKLGLKREREKIAEYYDEERGGWVETYVSYNKMKATVSTIYPVSKDTLEEVKEIFSKRVSKVIAEKIIYPRYTDFIRDTGIRHNVVVWSIFCKMQCEIFFNSNEQENREIIEKYLNEIIEIERDN